MLVTSRSKPQTDDVNKHQTSPLVPDDAYYFFSTASNDLHDIELSLTETHGYNPGMDQIPTRSLQQRELDLRNADFSSSIPIVTRQCKEIFQQNAFVESIKLNLPHNIEPRVLRDFLSSFDIPQWSLTNLFSQSGYILFSLFGEIREIALENEIEFPILSQISRISLVKPLPNGCGRCQLRLDMDYDEYCGDENLQEEFVANLQDELVRAFQSNMKSDDIQVGGLSSGSIVVFVFIPLLVLATAGLIGITWSCCRNWRESRAQSFVTRKKLGCGFENDDVDYITWDDKMTPEIDVGDTIIFWSNSFKKEHFVGSVCAIESTCCEDWRIRVCLPKEAYPKQTSWHSLSSSVKKLGRTMSGKLFGSSQQDDTHNCPAGMCCQWFGLKDWQSGRIEIGGRKPSSDVSFRGELRWRNAPSAFFRDGLTSESSLLIYRQFRANV